MTIGVSDGTTFKDSNEWLADAFKQTDNVSQMKEQGNIDLTARPQVKNEDGSVSTVRSMSIGTDQGEVLIPTVAHDGSRVLSDDEAVQQYRDSGKHLGIFQTPEQADKYAEMLHKSQADLYTGRPPGAPGEPADALNQAEGSQTPAKLSVLNSVRGMANPSFDEDKKILGGIYEGVKSALTLPGDVYSGKVPAGSVQEIERATDLAGLAIGGPAPVAAKMADGTLGSFAGVTSKTINKNKLYRAQNMELEGAHPDDIWTQTGFFKGADQRWRYEIPDNNVNILDKGTETIPGRPDIGWTDVGTSDKIGVRQPSTELPKDASLKDIFNHLSKPESKITLDKILDHQELYDAYPWMKNVPVKRMPEGTGNIAMVHNDTIFMSPMVPEQFTSVLLHEAQHMVQRREGFARGGTSAEYTPPALKEAKVQFEKAHDEFLQKNPQAMGKYEGIIEAEINGNINNFGPEFQQTLKEKLQQAKDEGVYNPISNIVKARKLLQEQDAKQYEQYARLAGEVEARNVQSRMNMGLMDRMLKTPRSTEDRPRFVQEVKDQSKR